MGDEIQILCCKNIRLTDIPEEYIGEKQDKIENLVLSNNALFEIPLSMSMLRNLQNLLIAKNPIEFLPGFFFQLRLLKTVDITEGLIKFIPDDIIQLQNLEKLWLTNNNLEVVSSNVFLLPKLSILALENNFLRGLFVPANYQLRNLLIFLVGNPINVFDLTNGLLGSNSLRNIFGDDIYITKEDQDDMEARFNRKRQMSTTNFIILVILTVIVLSIFTRTS